MSKAKKAKFSGVRFVAPPPMKLTRKPAPYSGFIAFGKNEYGDCVVDFGKSAKDATQNLENRILPDEIAEGTLRVIEVRP